MTLIAFATYGDRAEFITDSANYTHRVTHLGRVSKHVTIPHLDAAVLSQGDGDFGTAAKVGTLTLANDSTTFDELVESMPEVQRALWAERWAGQEVPEGKDGTVFLLGWSDTAGEFVAYVFAAEQDFKATRIKGAWCHPMPWEYRPSGVELRRMKRDMAGDADLARAAELWPLKPALPKPGSVDEWVALAKMSRQQRACDTTFFRILVAGDVFHTRLARGEITTRRVHRFNDQGEELAWMLRGTRHPIAMAAPCWCESGKPYGRCHANADAFDAADAATA